MATVGEIINTLRNFAPEDFQFKSEYDNVGLMLGDERATVTKVMCCLDVTANVINEAASEGAELIISHHPLIWSPLRSITADTVDGRKILAAAKAGISVYSSHTNLDFVKDGINDFVAFSLGLRNIEPLDAYISDEEGFGRVGNLSNKVYCTVLKGEVESLLKDNYVRIIGEPLAQVKRIAVINGGSGGDTKYIDMALKANADCLITADVKHHVAVYARECGLTVIEPQHFTMEHIYISRLVQILKIEAKSNKLNVEILQSSSENNPRF